MKIKKLQDKATSLENELADLYTMSEEAACFRYNVDCKQEAIDILNDEIQEAYNAIEEAEIEETTKEYAGWCDPAFRTMADFYRMRM